MPTPTERLKTLKKLLGVKNDDSDEVLLFTINSTIDMICNYCRLQSIPEKLDNVVLNIAMDLYRSRNFEQQQIEGTVKSITEGDVSVAFDTTNCMNLSTSDILKNYKIQLDRYRRMGW
ncbi:phage head-tail connector protein [Lachnospiraceae bacterium 46-61]